MGSQSSSSPAALCPPVPSPGGYPEDKIPGQPQSTACSLNDVVFSLLMTTLNETLKQREYRDVSNPIRNRNASLRSYNRQRHPIQEDFSTSQQLPNNPTDDIASDETDFDGLSSSRQLPELTPKDAKPSQPVNLDIHDLTQQRWNHEWT